MAPKRKMMASLIKNNETALAASDETDLGPVSVPVAQTIPYFSVVADSETEEPIIGTGIIPSKELITSTLSNLILNIMNQSNIHSDNVADFDQFWDHYYFTNGGGSAEPYDIRYFVDNEWVNFEPTAAIKESIWEDYKN